MGKEYPQEELLKLKKLIEDLADSLGKQIDKASTRVTESAFYHGKSVPRHIALRNQQLEASFYIGTQSF